MLNLRLSCRSASLACASTLLGVEALGLAGVSGGPALLVLLARWVLVLIWIQCWSGHSGGAGGRSRALPCQDGASLVPERAAAAASCTRPKTWRSAGAQLPSPDLAMNLIKSRR
jgi:hypothetical protein